ncbi:M23 family metallopeptidase [Sphingomonas sp. 179-I 2A4 NHS]|uniref:M23 family metallopeptidase n=1 Tax=unclassified Sphingomonas TaxID=196159 RepID=UPI003879B5DF
MKLIALIAPALLALALPSALLANPARLSSGFGIRIDPLHGARAVHRGIDLAAHAGTPVLAAATGVVRVAARRGSYGLLVELEHPDRSTTRYAHLSRILVRPDQEVRQGQPIGAIGSTGRATGSHLHFEYRVAGTPIDPLPHFGAAAPTATTPVTDAPEQRHRSRFAEASDGATMPPTRLPGGREARAILGR